MARGTGGGSGHTGIEGTVTVANPADIAVVERRQGTLGSWSPVFELAGGGAWADEIALDGKDYYYRAYAKRTGYANSSTANSTPTSGKPTEIGDL